MGKERIHQEQNRIDFCSKYTPLVFRFVNGVSFNPLCSMVPVWMTAGPQIFTHNCDANESALK